MEVVVDYATVKLVDEDDGIGGTSNANATKDMPLFIPMNYGAAHKISFGLGVHLMGAFNARERSVPYPLNYGTPLRLTSYTGRW